MAAVRQSATWSGCVGTYTARRSGANQRRLNPWRSLRTMGRLPPCEIEWLKTDPSLLGKILHILAFRGGSHAFRLSKLRGAVGAPARLHRNRGAAVGALPGDGRFRCLLAAQPVDPADEEEDGEGDEEEAQDVVQEETV